MGFLKGVGEFLFGSDPGAGARDALTQFGLKGSGEFGQSLTNNANQTAQLIGALQKQAIGRRNARSGLTGSGLGMDRLENADLTQADQLRQLRNAIINQRLQALGAVSGQPRQPGLIESIAPIASSLFLGPKTPKAAG